MKRWQPVRFTWPADELHAGFIGCPAPLLVVAAEARSDNIVPAFLSAKSHRDYMIKREIFGWEFLAAVLTRVVVSCVDICARKLYTVVILHADVFQKANDRGELDGESDRVHLLV